MGNKFRKKHVVITAYQWFEVSEYKEGVVRDVDYYRNPKCNGEDICKHCGEKMHEHGWINTLEGGHIVCPNDWIITGVKGKKYPCKPDIFEQTYDLVDDEVDDKVVITKKEYEDLLDKVDMLECLECCGVDNWVGYSEALEMHSEVEG